MTWQWKAGAHPAGGRSEPIAVAGAARHCLIQISDVSIAVGREKLLREQALVLRSQTFADG
jgi:hypothetical protein